MKEIWRYIKGTNRRYQVSNFGRVKSKKRKGVTRDRILSQYLVGRRFYAVLTKSNGKSSGKSVAKLVVDHFKKKEIGKNFAVHIDGNTFNNKSRNLKHGTRGDIFRKANELKKKKRGVYKFNHGNKKWRVVIKINNKSKTLGYFKNRTDAENCYINEYKKYYGRLPY